MRLTDGNTGQPLPEINLVEAIAHWGPGFKVIPRQQHAMSVPVRPGSTIMRVVFAQETWQN